MDYSRLKYKKSWRFTTKLIKARNRKLQASFSIQAMEDIQTMNKIDLKSEMIIRMINEL